MGMHLLLLTDTKGVFPTEGLHLVVYFIVFTRQCVRLVVFQVLLCSLKGRWYHWLTHERTFFRWFRGVHDCPLVELPLALACHVCRCGELYTWKIYILIMIRVQHLEPGDPARRMDFCHWITARPQLLSVILFTDEAPFTRDSINNSRSLHMWPHDNPHETSVTKFQRRFSVKVWCGLLSNKLIRPFVFDNNLTGNT